MIIGLNLKLLAMIAIVSPVVQQDLDLTKILMYSQEMLCGEYSYENSYRNSKDELKWPT